MSRWIGQIPIGRASAVSLFYVLVGSLWVIGADLYVHGASSLGLSSDLLASVAKGPAFILVTGVILFAVLYSSRQRLEDGHALQSLRFSQTITALARMVELRDIYTHGHQTRVAQICDTLAARMNLPRERRVALILAAELHDIGKIGAPKHPLNKAGFMTDAETARIQEHAAIVAQHHERLDGSGYPEKLAGEEILLEARILAVAGVFKAMSSARPYRNAQAAGLAMAELRRHAGVK